MISVSPSGYVYSTAEGMGFEPTRRGEAPHGLANRPGEPYPATFHNVFKVDLVGVEPILPASQAGVHSKYTTDTIGRVARPGLEPGTPR